jgi:hypothetical protein
MPGAESGTRDAPFGHLRTAPPAASRPAATGPRDWIKVKEPRQRAMRRARAGTCASEVEKPVTGSENRKYPPAEPGALLSEPLKAAGRGCCATPVTVASSRNNSRGRDSFPA